MNNQKILFTSVFGPYGIKNAYAESLGMQMELLNNQVTRAQGVHSPRQSYLSFALYLLAENISIPGTVLDFPSWKDFKNELKKGYSHVAISFIVPNVLKVKRMAEYIRKHYPDIKILLGGYGTIIPHLDEIVPFDDACKGEGVKWLREYFGEERDAPLIHPVLKNPVYSYTYGFKSSPRGSILLPGAGCKNGCSFCITSHMFKKEYLPFLESGEDVFNACIKIEAETEAANFMVMDENFLMKSDRAVELLALMEKYNKTYTFVLFCSANIIQNLGIDFFVRMGISRVWIGVESKNYSHEKVKGVDIKKLISDLQAHGIIVLASTILFQDHHDKKTIIEEIDWVNSLNSDLVQFMNYTPWPGTALYNELNQQGRLKPVPCRHQHGAGELLFDHPHFTRASDHKKYLLYAFKRKYKSGGPAIAKMARTALRGYMKAVKDYDERIGKKLHWNNKTLIYEKSKTGESDPYMNLRIKMMEQEALRYRPVLLPALIFSPDFRSRKMVYSIMKDFKKTFGPQSLKGDIKSAVLLFSAAIEMGRTLFAKLTGKEGIIRQPPCNRVEYSKGSR